MKYFILLLVLLVFTGCDSATGCNKQICDNGILKFNACRMSEHVIILDDNQQTIKCKGPQ